MSLREKLRTGPFFLDGGFGTLLQARGLRPGEAPEKWNLTHPEEITAIHREYYEAGGHMVSNNTFVITPSNVNVTSEAQPSPQVNPDSYNQATM